MPLSGSSLPEGACYRSPDGRDMAMLNLMRVAHRLFSQVSFISRTEELRGICNRGLPIEEIHRFSMSTDLPFLDAFKMVCAFEHLLKAQLLGSSFVVHKFDPKAGPAFKKLADIQRCRPVEIVELREAEGRSWRESDHFTIRGLLSQSIDFKWLINKKTYYHSVLGLSADLIFALERCRLHRNTIHLCLNDIGRFNSQIADGYVVMRRDFNERFLARYSGLLNKYDHWRSDESLFLNAV